MGKTCCLLLAACLALLFAGCDELFYAGLNEAESTPDRPVFLLGKDGSLFHGMAKVYGFRLSGRPRKPPPRPDAVNLWLEFWSAQADSGLRYIEVHKIAYGELPERTFLVFGPDTLRAGFIYSFNPWYHGLGTAAYFEITQDSSGARAIHALTEEEFLAIIHDTL